ncbi:MAG: hypothetical protein QM811_02015 [Pirellulales bacterium]
MTSDTRPSAGRFFSDPTAYGYAGHRTQWLFAIPFLAFLGFVYYVIFIYDWQQKPEYVFERAFGQAPPPEVTELRSFTSIALKGCTTYVLVCSIERDALEKLLAVRNCAAARSV